MPGEKGGGCETAPRGCWARDRRPLHPQQDRKGGPHRAEDVWIRRAVESGAALRIRSEFDKRAAAANTAGFMRGRFVRTWFVLRRWIPPAAVVLLGMPPAIAAPQGSDETRPHIYHVRPGYGFQTRIGFWNPLFLEIENPGTATRVVATIESTGERSSQSLCIQRRATLPARSRMKVFVPIFPDREAVGDSRATEFADAILGDGSAARWGGLSVMGALAPLERPLHLVCEAESRSYNFVKTRRVAGREIEVGRAVVSPSEMPARVLALSPVDVVLLGALGGRRLDAFQAQALRRWIEQGGVLAIVPGEGFDPTDLGALESRLPVVYGAPVLVHEVPLLAEEGVPPFFAPDGIRYRPMTLRAGRVKLGPPEAPIVAECRVGDGRIIAFALDLGDEAFAQWPGASAFWSRHVPLPPVSVRYAAHRLSQREILPPLIQEMAGIEVPSRRQAHLYLAAVSALVFVPILLGHLFRCPVGGWGVSLLLALGSGLAAMRAGRPPADASAPQLIEVFQARGHSGGARMSLQAALGLYAPMGGRFSVRGTDDGVAPRPGIESASPPERFEAVWTDRIEVEGLQVRPRSVRALAVECAVSAAAEPEAEIVFDEKGMHSRVANPAETPLEDAFVRVGRLVAPLGDIAPGAERTLSAVRPEEPRSDMVYSLRAVRRVRDLARDRLFAALYPPFQADAAPTRDPIAGAIAAMVFGGEWDEPAVGYWTETPRTALAPTTPPTSRRALGFVRIVPAVRYEGNRILWPRGTLSVGVERRTPALRVHPDGFYSGWQADEFALSFALPDDAPAIVPERLRVFRRLESDDFELAATLEATDGGSSLHLSPATLATTEIETPERFYDARARAVRLVAQIRPRPGAGERGWSQPWIVRDLDVELMGRVVPPPEGAPHR